MDYFLDRRAFRRAMKQAEFENPAQFLNASGLHRNTLGQYLRNERSVFSSGFLRIAESLKVDPLTLIRPETQSYTINTKSTLVALLTEALRSHPELCAVLLGSRAKGSATQFSDWDIGLTSGNSELESEEYLEVKERILELADDLPVGVDIVNLDQAPSWFLREIDYEPEFLTGEKSHLLFLQGVLNGIRKNNIRQEAA